MCGIAGAVSFSARWVEETTLLAMCEAIRHRGPDDRGIVTLPADRRPSQASVGLGNQRLAIIDVAGGHQPIPNEDETIWTVLNGELYNFQALRRDLEARGHRFRTSSDTEVIAHLYEEKGDAFVADLDGMSALALWDSRRGRLLLARDRFGKKPLLYVDEGERLRFGSEFQALLAGGDLSLELDVDALDAYLTFMSIPASLTIYRAIRKLPPASLLIRDKNGVRITPYWTLDYGPKHDLSEQEAVERVRQLLTGAVRKRLISEVPLRRIPERRDRFERRRRDHGRIDRGRSRSASPTPITTSCPTRAAWRPGTAAIITSSSWSRARWTCCRRWCGTMASRTRTRRRSRRSTWHGSRGST
jgi:asparagine synthase (glutamine-hydrolysing)